MEAKAGINIILFEEETKHGEREEQIQLRRIKISSGHGEGTLLYLSNSEQFESVAERPVTKFVGQNCQYLFLTASLTRHLLVCWHSNKTSSQPLQYLLLHFIRHFFHPLFLFLDPLSLSSSLFSLQQPRFQKSVKQNYNFIPPKSIQVCITMCRPVDNDIIITSSEYHVIYLLEPSTT